MTAPDDALAVLRELVAVERQIQANDYDTATLERHEVLMERAEALLARAGQAVPHPDLIDRARSLLVASTAVLRVVARDVEDHPEFARALAEEHREDLVAFLTAWTEAPPTDTETPEDQP